MLCLLIITLRGWSRLFHPGIWAEDGTVHLLGALQGKSLFTPADGYIQFLQRLLLLVSIQLSFKWIAAFICISCYLLYALIISSISSVEFAWLIPSITIRSILCILLCFAPGLTEILGNAANLYHVLFLALLFIGLQNLEKPLSYIDTVFVFFLAGSTGPSILALPLYAWRLWTGMQKQFPIKKLSPTIGCLLILLGFSTANFLFRNSIPLKTDFTLSQVGIGLQSVLGQLLFAPFFGGYLTVATMKYNSLIAWSFSFVACISLFLFFVSRFKLAIIPLVLFTAAIFAFPIVTVIVRPDSINVYTVLPMSTMWFWGFRYAFLVYAAGLFIWFIALSQLLEVNPHKGTLPIYLIIAFIGFCTVNQMAWSVSRYGKRHWTKQAELLERSYRTGNPGNVLIPIYPDGWKLRYHHASSLDQNESSLLNATQPSEG